MLEHEERTTDGKISETVAVAPETTSSAKSMREVMTKSITYYLAAARITNKKFPSKAVMPKLHPLPFNSFGHSLLLDYKLFVTIVWQVAIDIQTTLEDASGGVSVVPILMALAAAVVGGLVASQIVPDYSCIGVSAFLTGIVVFGVFHSKRGKAKPLAKEVANTRARAIKQLIDGDFEVATGTEIAQAVSRELKLVGDGVLDGDRAPVLTILTDKHPFPGFGQLQAQNLFVCRPQKSDVENASVSSMDKIRSAISENVINTVSDYGEDVSFGDVVVVHGNSLFIDSPWLDKDKVPFLWLERDKLEQAKLIDPRASVRIYFATQVIFPQYMTVATLFVRPFMAGNSASCQIAVTTIGPSIFGTDYFQRRLLKHKMEAENGLTKTGSQTKKNEASSYAMQRLRSLRSKVQEEEEFQSDLNIDEIKKLDPLEEGEEYADELGRMVEESVMWPGYFGGMNIAQAMREVYSLTFTPDFFGQTEAMASVKTLYDQIARTVLDSLDALGFDISDYRDSEGNYSISAEKIDQLVLGERIEITQSKESDKAPEEKSE